MEQEKKPRAPKSKVAKNEKQEQAETFDLMDMETQEQRPQMTRAQLLRAGRINRKSGKMSAIERMQCFKISLSITEQAMRNNITVNTVNINHAPYIHIERARKMVENMPTGYMLKIEHNPKKWLTGEKHLTEYEACVAVEHAVAAYNERNGGQQ